MTKTENKKLIRLCQRIDKIYYSYCPWDYSDLIDYSNGLPLRLIVNDAVDSNFKNALDWLDGFEEEECERLINDIKEFLGR